MLTIAIRKSNEQLLRSTRQKPIVNGASVSLISPPINADDADSEIRFLPQIDADDADSERL